MDKSSGDIHTYRPLKPLVIKGIWVLNALELLKFKIRIKKVKTYTVARYVLI